MAAGDKERKTLPPTAKKKREARQEGRIAKSQELAGWVVVLAATVAFPSAFRYVTSQIEGLVSQSAKVMSHPDRGQAIAAFEHGLKVFATTSLTIAGVLTAVTILVNVAQVGFVFAAKSARPQLSRLNPKQGLSRIFSPAGLWQLVKTFLKVAVIAFIAYRLLSKAIHTVLGGATPVTLEPMLGFTAQTVLTIVRYIALIGLVISIFDYAYQRHRTNQSLRMSRDEMKDEMRQTEGDPTTKRRIRMQQRRLSRLRMMAAVAQADVVITNPTHVAVALQYDKRSFLAPKVVAKGEGEIARAIKEEALRVGVPVVEDPPLARAVNAACEIGDTIPRELYMAVAHLLAFVYSLSVDARLLGVVFRRPVSSLGL